MSIEQKFLRYIQMDTQSEEGKETTPSTEKQFLLGKQLVKELHALGVTNAYLDEYCYVYGYIPGNQENTKTIGLIAHLDTATELTGANVHPQVIRDYDGSEIVLNEDLGITLSPNEFSSLSKKIGHTLITTDGTTLLGGDDKAGIAIIMEVVEQLYQTPSLSRPNIIVTFTPDEEVGMGTFHFNYTYYQEHNCHMAYTIDGGPIDVINFENFNAASATIEIRGKSIHPGSAKNKMVNSLHLAMEFHQMLPADMVPSKTENYEGFNHLNHMEGSVDHTIMHYIIRNHDMPKFREQIQLFESITQFLNQKYGTDTYTTIIKDTYYNMRELVLKNPEILEYAIKGIQKEGFSPTLEPIRGGTDGAHLSFHGVITPNLGTGGENCHGRYEYVSINDMEKMVRIILRIFQIMGK